MSQIKKIDDLFNLKKEKVKEEILKKSKIIEIDSQNYYIYKFKSKKCIISFNKNFNTKTIQEIFEKYNNYEIFFIN